MFQTVERCEIIVVMYRLTFLGPALEMHAGGLTWKQGESHDFDDKYAAERMMQTYRYAVWSLEEVGFKPAPMPALMSAPTPAPTPASSKRRKKTTPKPEAEAESEPPQLAESPQLAEPPVVESLSSSEEEE